mmetsp:Transcript_18261/g.40570  ORF Transcript_18261/g.40570 Transcript_18261/m.40570 type:complete len:479 (+) Transcript_18261:376-1812(+)
MLASLPLLPRVRPPPAPRRCCRPRGKGVVAAALFTLLAAASFTLLGIFIGVHQRPLAEYAIDTVVNSVIAPTSIISATRSGGPTSAGQSVDKQPSVAFTICLYAEERAADGTLTMAPMLAVLAASVRRIAPRSRYRTHLVALVRRELVASMGSALEEFGFVVVPCDPPVSIDDMEEPGKTAAMSNKHHRGSNPWRIVEENDKLHIFTLTQYDRVVLLDTDVVVLEPIDELLDDPAEALGILDYYMLGEDKPENRNPLGGMKLSVVPPINGGFTVVRPSNNTFSELTSMSRRGDFRGSGTPDGYSRGWDGLGVGFYFGGISYQGLLTAVYFKSVIEDRGNKTRYEAVQEALASPKRRFREVDQCVYNVLGHKNCWGREGGLQGTPRCRNVDCSPAANPTLEGVKQGLKVIHFTGTCNDARPWDLCNKPAPNRYKHVCELCHEFSRRWIGVATTMFNGTESQLYSRLAPTLQDCLNKLKE